MMRFYTLRRVISHVFTWRASLLLLIGLTFVTCYTRDFWSERIGLGSGTSVESGSPDSERASFQLPPRIEISPIYYPNNVIVPRSVIGCPAGECVIEHRFEEWTPLVPLSSMILQNEYAELAYEPGNPWYRGQDKWICSATFNCATFAVAEYIHLKPNELLRTVPASDGYPTPIAVILDSYFNVVCGWSVAQAIDRGEFETAEMLHEGDVIAFEMPFQEPDRTRRSITHLGIVKKQNGCNRLLSKFGQGPVLLSDLKFPQRLFPGAQKITIYRFRGNHREISWNNSAAATGDRSVAMESRSWHPLHRIHPTHAAFSVQSSDWPPDGFPRITDLMVLR